MPTPPQHYRFALGECNNEHAYIIKSRKGIAWGNIDSELEDILSDLNTNDLLDFSLGTEDRWYVKYISAGRERRRLSRNLWDEIGQSHHDTLDRLVLGAYGEYWGVTVRGDQQYDFRGGSSRFRQQFNNNTQRVTSWDDVEFVTFGFSGDYIFRAGGEMQIQSGCEALLDSIRRADEINVSTVVLSAWPTASNKWLVILNDGTIEHRLPRSIARVVDDYMQPGYSLLSRQTRSSVVHSTGFAQVVTPQRITGAHNRQPTPLLESIEDPYDPNFDFVEDLFTTGWLHYEKNQPAIQRVFVINLPPGIMQPYEHYKSTVAGVIGLPDGNEKFLFHGTNRSCRLGDSSSWTQPCNRVDCNLCPILRQSFQVTLAGSSRDFLRFGRGIYSTPVSSKADDYIESNTGSKVMIVARVVVGNSKTLRRTQRNLTSPPRGYHSVFGEAGQDLNYSETVVYNNAAIRPAYLVVYEPDADYWSDTLTD